MISVTILVAALAIQPHCIVHPNNLVIMKCEGYAPQVPTKQGIKPNSGKPYENWTSPFGPSK